MAKPIAKPITKNLKTLPIETLELVASFLAFEDRPLEAMRLIDRIKLKKLSKILLARIVNYLPMRNLNAVMIGLGERPPSAEAIAASDLEAPSGETKISAANSESETYQAEVSMVF